MTALSTVEKPKVKQKNRTTNLFKNLGAGVGLRPDFFSEFKGRHPASVSWVEVISENFMRWQNGLLPRVPLASLKIVRQDLPISLHGVSLNLGSADPLDKTYLKNLKELVEIIQPEQVSDHLCWTGVDGENFHELLPLPYTEEAIQHISNRILSVQDFLGRRILIENLSSYVGFEASEMSEWEFLNEVARRADCGLLLDINNIYVSSLNHEFSPVDYLKSLPFERVGQIHLAGHSEINGKIIDTHDQPVCKEVWDLFRWTIKNLGIASTMIERDGNIPDWSELNQEILQIGLLLGEAENESRPAAANI